MSTVRTAILSTVALAVVAAWSLGSMPVGAQGGSQTTMTSQGTMKGMGGQMAGMPTMTKDQKMATAMSAAPASVSAKATILAWPAKEGGALTTLRAGTNGWTCLPDMPDTTGNDPMCLDKSWMTWFDAYMNHKTPQVTTTGIGYMTAPGGAFGSNTDPYAMKETADNHWGMHPPHVMILVPDLRSLNGISTDPANGGPYVMFAGTPYAHIMAPVAGAMMGSMTK